MFTPWSDETCSGGYIDLACGVRVIGSNWYGSAAPRAIEQLAEAIEQLPPGPDHTVLMFHHGLEGQIARYAGALRYSDLLPLKAAGIDYLALGHIHKQYAVEDWIFNPGSLEANNIEESCYERGAYLVELNGTGVSAELQRGYFQRPIMRLELKAKGNESLDELTQMAHEVVEQAVNGKQTSELAPIIELRITGQVGFDRLELDARRLQEDLKTASDALLVLLKYEVEDGGYQTPVSDVQSRLEIEQTIFEDIVGGPPRLQAASRAPG